MAVKTIIPNMTGTGRRKIRPPNGSKAPNVIRRKVWEMFPTVFHPDSKNVKTHGVEPPVIPVYEYRIMPHSRVEGWNYEKSQTFCGYDQPATRRFCCFSPLVQEWPGSYSFAHPLLIPTLSWSSSVVSVLAQ